MSTYELQIFVVVNPCGVLCRAPVVCGHRRQWIRGVSNPPVFSGLRPGPRPGVAHAPLVAAVVSTEIAIAKSFARHLESPIGTPF